MAKRKQPNPTPLVKPTQFIRQIRIQNFRCFRDITIDLEPLNSIVGENGAGKTTILDALYYALSPSVSASRFDEQDFNDQDVDHIEVEVIFNEDVIAELPDGWARQEVPCKGVYLQVKRRDKAAPGHAFSEEFVITHHLIPNDSVRVTEKGYYLARKSSGAKPFQFTPRDLSLHVSTANSLRCFYFPKNREKELKVGFNSTFERVTKEFNWRFRKELESFKEDYLTKWAEIQKIIEDSLSKSKIDDAFTEVKAKLKKLLGKDFEKLEISIFNLETPFAKAFFSLRNGLNQIAYDGLGSGISMILTFCLLETISSLSKERLIVLIDEPELHLHPQLQQKLFDHLQASESQIVISTHSERMIDIANWESIKRVNTSFECMPKKETLDLAKQFKKKNQTVREYLNGIKEYHQDKVIFFKEDNEMLFARKCLLVEGQGEKYGLPILAKKLEISLDDVTVINCKGKAKIPIFQLLCTAYGIPYFTVFDLDGLPENDQDNKPIIGWCDTNQFFTFVDTFEHLFETQKSIHKGSATIEAISKIDNPPKEIVNLFEAMKKFLG